MAAVVYAHNSAFPHLYTILGIEYSLMVDIDRQLTTAGSCFEFILWSGHRPH